MNKTKRFLFVFMAMLMILSFGFSAIAAVTSTAYYNVTSETEIIPFSNSTNFNMYGNFNTTPYIVLDEGATYMKIYHCGASSKDAGKRITTITELRDINEYRAAIKEMLKNPVLQLV